jgi:hypothetical protein
MPCFKDPSRVDPTGRAHAGSQRQIQAYVNDHTSDLSACVARALTSPILENSRIVWVSPLASNNYDEYRDSEFLIALGLARLIPQLRNFWARGGPCWDALARIEGSACDGCILVEAKKATSPKSTGNGCCARGQSRVQIQAALDMTKRWLGVSPAADWTGRLYQSANRYAHLYFLREIAGADAYLANVYFVGDPHSPTGQEEWERETDRLQRELGVSCPVPFTAKLFLRSVA